MRYTTLLFDLADHVATVTLNRPERLNAFNQTMCDEFADLWSRVRLDDDIHAVVLRAAGDRAFCTGVDVSEGLEMSSRSNVWSEQDPGIALGPKMNAVWKPVVCAAHGMVAGGAFYFVNEADILICSDDATFFDPHVTYGLTAVLEPIGLAARVPLGEALRIALLGLDERMSAARAHTIGLVSEVTTREQLWPRADALARRIAAKPPRAIQGTVKAIWESRDVGRAEALRRGLMYTQIGNPPPGSDTDLGGGQVYRATTEKPQWELR
jgi:enoyl-CoA hydratase/carnithine racemase